MKKQIVLFFVALFVLGITAVGCKQDDPFTDSGNTGDKFPAPTWVSQSATVDSSSVNVSWNAVSGNNKYELKVKDPSGKLESYKTSSTSKTFSAKQNGVHQCMVRVKNAFSSGAWSTSINMTVDVKPPATPSSISVSTYDSSDGKVKVTVSSVANADYYKIEYADNASFTGKKTKTISSTSSTLSFNFFGDVYLRAKAGNINPTESGYVTLSKPVKINIKPSFYTAVEYDENGKYYLKWTSISNASKYEIKETYGSNVQTNTTTYTTYGYYHTYYRTYSYQVRAITSNGNTEYSAPVTYTVREPYSPDLYNLPSESTTGRFNITWESIGNAVGYELRMEGPEGTKTFSTGYTSQQVVVSTDGNYTFKVRAFNPVGKSGWSNSDTVNVQFPVDGGDDTDPYGNGDGTDPYGDDNNGGTDPYGSGSNDGGTDPYGDDSSDPYGDDNTDPFN